jgi:hypothetical protein
MRNLRWFGTAMVLLFLAGCFQVTTVVRVNPDGSGTVEETMLLSKKFLASMDEMMQAFAGEGGAKPEPLQLFEPDKLKAQAAAMGEGVSYSSGKKVETADFSGYTANYAFTDITRLRLSRQGGEAAAPAAAGGKNEAMPLFFRFSKGSPATLTIEHPPEKPQEKSQEKVASAATPVPEAETKAPAESRGAQADEEARKLTEQFLGLKYLLAIEVNGTIVSTNATHRDGNRLTIFELDLAKFGTALPRLEKLSRLQGGSLAEAKELLKDFPGMKVDLNDRLTVVFGK